MKSWTGWLGVMVASGLLAGLTQAANLYVASSGDNSNDGTWGGAFTTLQAAIDAATDGDTIYIKGETFTLSGPNPATGLLYWGPGKNNLTIEGGYAGTDPAPGPFGDTPTVLRGPSSEPSPPSTTNRVLYIDSVTNATLSRVTIRGGSIGGGVQHASRIDAQGAGIYVNASSNLVLLAVTLTANTIYSGQQRESYGGGLYALNSFGTLTNSVLSRNTLRLGYIGNHRGAGMHLSGGGWTVRDCTIRENSIGTTPTYGDTRLGAGIYIHSGTHTIKNCLVTRNVAGPSVTNPQGEGIYVANGTVDIDNCTLYWNRQEGLRRANGSVTLRNSIVWANNANIVGTVTRVNSAVEGVDNAADPQFDRGLFLAPTSPYHDAGSMTVAEAGLTGYTVRADGTADSGNVALGYHFPPGTAAVDYYVDAVNGLDSNTGLASGAAYKTITKALSMIGHGSHVHVAAGLYDLTNGETFPLTVNGLYGIQILGAGRDDTIIDAHNANQRCLGMTYVYPGARVSDLTLKRGRLTAGSSRGGGLYLAHVQGLVTDCDITDNVLPNPNGWGGPGGGGLAAIMSAVTVSNAFIARNTVTAWYADHSYGGGVHFNNNQGMITHSTIVSNTANASGDNSWATHAYGGGLYITGDTTVRNCLITHNDARTTSFSTPHGDAAHVAGGTVLFENCTIVTNHPTSHPRRTTGPESIGIERGGGTVTVNNSILWGNGMDVLGAMTVNWSNVGEADAAATTNNCISLDPRFVDVAAGNFRLSVKGGDLSPSANAGNPVAADWMLTGVDLDGNDRILNARVDQGAYENLIPPPGSLILLR